MAQKFRILYKSPGGHRHVAVIEADTSGEAEEKLIKSFQILTCEQLDQLSFHSNHAAS